MVQSIMIGVGAIIENDAGKILLAKHIPQRGGYWQGKWICPGGKLKLGESIEDGIRREVKEETGFDVEICGETYAHHGGEHEMLLIPESMHIHPIDVEHDHFGFDFFCRVKGRETEGCEEEKYKWFTEEELENYPSDATTRLPKHVRVMAAKAIQKLGCGA